MTKCFTIGCTQHAVDNTLWCAEHGPKPATGSTLYLMERDQWKERALAAESKLEQSLDINAKLAEENVQEHRLVESLQSRLDALTRNIGVAYDILSDAIAEEDHHVVVARTAVWLAANEGFLVEKLEPK